MSVPSDPNWYVSAAWTALIVIWIGAAFGVKRIQRSTSRGRRLTELLLLAVAFGLLFKSASLSGPLALQVTPASAPFEWGGVAVTLAALAFTTCARFWLGSNWSGIAAVKHGHSLVRGGPYSLVRHPIYSGLILASLGTALVYGRAGCFLALPLTIAIFKMRSRTEEAFMREEFGAEYEQYMREVQALIPYVW